VASGFTVPDAARLYDEAPVALLVARRDGLIESANATCCRWLGYQREELVGRLRLPDLFTIGGKLFHQTHIAPLLQMQGSVAEVQLELRHSDGHQIPVMLNILRRAVADGWHDEVAFLVASDRRKYEQELLRARKAAEAASAERRAALDSLGASEQRLRELNEQLQLANQRKDEFLAVLAHELRNPLTPMRSGLDLLKLRQVADPLVQRTLAVFARQVAHMTRLVDDLLDASRIGKGKLELRRRRVAVEEFVKAAVDLALPLMQDAGQSLESAPVPAPLFVDGDPVRLTQALANLLNNASKYTPRGGRIRVWAEAQGALVVISVQDNGYGIEASQLQHIFELFAQLPSTQGSARGGIGVGLALVRGLVEAHGGSVHAHSDGPGRGSTFRIELPAVD
jgi:PAS domain S-box-containing protein